MPIKSRKTLSVSSFKDQMKEWIREAILSGQLKPGERIVETEIARSFGISQVPVREALRGLEEEGLVRTVKHKGAFVADLIPIEVYHVFRLRTHVEMTALGLVTPKLTHAQIAELDGIVEEMREVVDDANYVIQSELDVRFHSRIIAWTEVELYQRVWRMLYGHVRRFISFVHPTFFSENHAKVVKQHEELLAVLKIRDVVKVKEAFADHIMLLWRQEGERWLEGNSFSNTP